MKLLASMFGFVDGVVGGGAGGGGAGCGGGRGGARRCRLAAMAARLAAMAAAAAAEAAVSGWEVGTSFAGRAAGYGLREVNARGRVAFIVDEEAVRDGPADGTGGADEGAAPKLSCWFCRLGARV